MPIIPPLLAVQVAEDAAPVIKSVDIQQPVRELSKFTVLLEAKDDIQLAGKSDAYLKSSLRCQTTLAIVLSD